MLSLPYRIKILAKSLKYLFSISSLSSAGKDPRNTSVCKLLLRDLAHIK